MCSWRRPQTGSAGLQGGIGVGPALLAPRPITLPVLARAMQMMGNGRKEKKERLDSTLMSWSTHELVRLLTNNLLKAVPRVIRFGGLDYQECVAHELNNIIRTLTLRVQLLSRGKDPASLDKSLCMHVYLSNDVFVRRLSSSILESRPDFWMI